MILITRFNIGDTVFTPTSYGKIAGPLTIGMVEKRIVDSPGVKDSMGAYNFSPQSSIEERYMMVETGVGSGRIYDLEFVHFTAEEALIQSRIIFKKE